MRGGGVVASGWVLGVGVECGGDLVRGKRREGVCCTRFMNIFHP